MSPPELAASEGEPLLIVPQAWVERYAPLPSGWWLRHAPALLRKVPALPERLDDLCRRHDVDPRLLIVRMQAEQSALTYAWDESARDYVGGDAEKLRYLCGADRTDGGDRAGGWFGWERQLQAVVGRFCYWYRGRSGPGLPNWLGLTEDPKFRAGRPCKVAGGTIVPANQASADSLRYTPHRQAAELVRSIGRRFFGADYEA